VGPWEESQSDFGPTFRLDAAADTRCVAELSGMGRTGTARSRQVDRYRYRRFGQLGVVERDENLGTAERWLMRGALNRRADLERGCDVLFDEAVRHLISEITEACVSPRVLSAAAATLSV
jgi:hypothetical protein